MKIPEAIRQDKNIKWILLIGLLQTAACAVTYWFRISNPNIILIVILSAALVQFGYKAGILCGGIIYLYTMFYFSVEHSFWIFDTDGRSKVMVVAIYNLLGIICNYFQADRSYIFDIDYEKQIVINTYEYAAEGVSCQIDNLQEVPLSVIEVWMDRFKKGEVYYIADTKQEKGYPSYEMLVEQKVQRLLTVPLKKNEKIIGFVGVDNPRTHFDDATLLLSLQYFIVNSQSSQKQQERLQFLSFRDMLTGLYNRNKYMKVLESCEYFPVRDTGVAYIDLNGLKQVNDSLGHEAGDRLICSAAQCILKTFPENAYRIGGDEFVIIVAKTAEADFMERIKQVQEDLEEAEVSCSIGLEWKNESMIEAMLKAAEKRMYIEKNAYYQVKGRDRRGLVKT